MDDNLFVMRNLALEDSRLTAEIVINWDSKVFDGHFPGRPVLPGVVMLRIIRQALELHFERKLMMVKLLSIRFTSMVVPEENLNERIDLVVNEIDGALTVSGKWLHGESVAAKFKMSYRNE